MCLWKMSPSKAPQSLSELHLPGIVWVASDIHLSENTPGTTAAFLDFLNQAATRADALLLPGDIFDVWIGDDFALQSPPQWLHAILEALLKASTHLRLFLGRGNRDFLMGRALAQRVGASLLPYRVRLRTDFGAVLLSHGDEYCTADKNYQRFRRLVHRPLVQRAFLALSLDTRRSIAAWARGRSRQHNAVKSMSIMDVHPQAVHDAFAENGCTLMVHGHTHRPGQHTHSVSGRDYQRIVLPDWDFDTPGIARGGWLALDAKGPVLHRMDP